MIEKRIQTQQNQQGKALDVLLQCKTAEERMRRLQDIENDLDLTDDELERRRRLCSGSRQRRRGLDG